MMVSIFPINDLPVELVLDVFKSLSSMADVNHLAATSRYYYNICKSNERTICRTVLQRNVLCYDLASELAKTIVLQEEGYPEEHMPVVNANSDFSRAA